MEFDRHISRLFATQEKPSEAAATQNIVIEITVMTFSYVVIFPSFWYSIGQVRHAKSERRLPHINSEFLGAASVRGGIG